MEFKPGIIVRLKDEKFEEIKKYYLFPQNAFIIERVYEIDKTVIFKGLKDIIIENKFLEPFGEKDDLSNLKEVLSIEDGHLVTNFHIDIDNEEKSPSRLKVNDIGNLLSIAKYEEIVARDEKVQKAHKVFFKKQIRSTETAVSTKNLEKSSYVLILKPEYGYLYPYIAFFFDSAFGKYVLINASPTLKLSGVTNMQIIKNANFAFISKYVLACCVYQNFIEQLFSLGSSKKEEVEPLFDFLRRIRNAMVLENCMPSLFEEAKLKILDSWVLEINKAQTDMLDLMDGKLTFETMKKVFDSLFSDKNELVQNMNKFRLYANDIQKRTSE